MPRPPRIGAHVGFRYSYQLTRDAWPFRHKSGEVATAHPSGPFRVNNGYAMLPSLIAGLGLAVLPEFIAGAALASGELEIVLPEWSLPVSAIYWVTPPGGLRSKRIEVLAEYLATHFCQKKG